MSDSFTRPDDSADLIAVVVGPESVSLSVKLSMPALSAAASASVWVP